MQIEELYQIFLESGNICTDTRKITKSSIYFALRGENFDGNHYAEKALQDGCSYAVVDNPEMVKNPRNILMKDSLQTLQNLALFHRNTLSIPIIGITGSNGKTTTKELIREVLKEKFNVIATEGNLNNHIGVPLSILKINKNHEIAIIEMGANHQGEIKFLCELSKPDFGIITNIGKAHLEGFGGPEGVIKAKNELYVALRERNARAFVNSDNQLLMDLSKEIERITYGFNSNSDVIGKIQNTGPCVQMEWFAKNDHNKKGSHIQTKIPGLYNAENILAAISIGHYFGVHPEKIKQGIENYIPALNRSQLILRETNKILLDAYNANPTSMEAAISNFIKLEGENKVLILGEMLELGELSESEHSSLIDLLKKMELRNVYLVGKSFKLQENLNGFFLFSDTTEAIEYFRQNPIKNSFLLIKGSRGNKLEQLVEVF